MYLEQRQIVFDRVSTHLLTQKKRSITGGSCQYRTEEGLTCAVGCLISDSEYTEDLETQPSCSYDVKVAVGNSTGFQMESRMMSLLDALQDLHDVHDPAFWPQGLAEIAKDFQLTFSGGDLTSETP